MAEHTAEIRWTATAHPDQPDTFSRDHIVRLENGHELLNSSAPAYFGNPAAANPETLLLAALAGCKGTADADNRPVGVRDFPKAYRPVSTVVTNEFSNLA